MNHSDIEHMAQGYPPSHIGKDYEEVVTWLATQLLATQEQRDALAVESAHYKTVAEKMAERADDYKSGHLGFSVFDSVNELKQGLKTPATDAYLNSVRAEGIDYLASEAGEMVQKFYQGSSDWKQWKSIVFFAVTVADQLRAGEPS